LDHRCVARIGLSLLCGIQGIATIALDLNRTHATNPKWLGHARFHVVWQTLTIALQSVVELGLLWSGFVGEALGFYLALLLASLSSLAFMLSLAAKSRFGGTLSDPNGIPPVRVALGGLVIEVDMNLAAVLAALVTIGALILIYKF